MPMIGELRHRVTIQNATEASDGAGGFTATWSDVATVWAKVEPLRGYEAKEAMQLEAPTIHRIFMRYRSDVRANTSRLVFDGRNLDIKEVRNLTERGRWLEILAEEGKI
jgi:SPP1 family predicted phage head-tail adaptor